MPALSKMNKAELLAEVQRLQAYEPKLLGIEVGPRSAEIRLAVAKGAMALLVRAFDQLNGTANYSETEISTEGRHYRVIVQNCDKPTPHELKNQAFDLLNTMYQRTGLIDNGSCAVCQIGHRLWNTGQLPKKLKAPQAPCSNPRCLSHAIEQLLATRNH